MIFGKDERFHEGIVIRRVGFFPDPLQCSLKYRSAGIPARIFQQEKVALEYAEAMTITNTEITDELFNRLREHFDDDAICELTGLIAFQNLSSKFNATLDVQPQGFCRIAPQRKKPVDKT